MLVGFIKFYLTLNVILILLGLAVKIVLLVAQRSRVRCYSEINQGFKYTLIVGLILAAFSGLIPLQEFTSPKAQIWSARSARETSTQLPALALSLSGASKVWSPLDGGLRELSVLSCLLIGLSLAGASYWRQRRRVEILLRTSTTWRRAKKLSIVIFDEEVSPFAFSNFSWRYVAIPQSMISNKKHLQIALSHELQHLRQGDPQITHLLGLIQHLCFFNPWVYWLVRDAGELQEMSCDENLLGRANVSAREYGNCLVWVADQMQKASFTPVGTTGMSGLHAKTFLSRRVQMIFQGRKELKDRRLVRFGFAVLMMGFCGVSFGLSQSVQDFRVTRSQAEEMLSTAKSESGFPLEVNEEVLIQLNRLLGTPDGRKFMREGIHRMSEFQSMIETELNQHRLPLELLVVPLMESGYRNELPNRRQGVGAGIWMFIAQTARAYGLRVDSAVDERLDPRLETDAAMRLLKTDFLRFEDWGLALMAYNMGESRLQSAIDVEQSRDPWTLIRAGHENDQNYLAKLVAAALIVKNQEMLK